MKAASFVTALSVAAILAGPVLSAEPQPAPAQPTAAADKAKPAKAKPAKEKLVCDEEQLLGSRVARVVCRTQTEADEEHYRGLKTRDQMRNDGAGTSQVAPNH